MIKQTDPRNNFIVQHFGCYLYDLFKITEESRGESWDFDKVNAIYQASMKAGFVGYMIGERFYPGENTSPPDGCFVEDVSAVLQLAGCPKTQILMGPLDGGMWPMNTTPRDGDAIIQKWHNDRTGFNHYVVGNPNGTCKWDPISRGNGLGSVTVAEGHPVSMRLIQFL
jgi:hypothetical protein